LGRNHIRRCVSGKANSYLCQLGKCCDGRVCLANDHVGDGGDGGGEEVPRGVSDACEVLQSVPGPGRLR